MLLYATQAATYAVRGVLTWKYTADAPVSGIHLLVEHCPVCGPGGWCFLRRTFDASNAFCGKCQKCNHNISDTVRESTALVQLAAGMVICRKDIPVSGEPALALRHVLVEDVRHTSDRCLECRACRSPTPEDTSMSEYSDEQ